MDSNNDFENKNEEEIVEIEQEISEEEESDKKKKSAGRELLEWVQAIVIAIVVALVVRNFVFTVVMVDGESMMPTLQDRNRMVVWRLGYEPERGDIVVFNPPGEPEDVYYIKRVIATEGETVRIDYETNSVYVNGEKIDEPYLGEPMIDPGSELYISECEVGPGQIFVMGDNRNNSCDSRLEEINAISEDRVIGEAVLRFWPLSDIETY